MKRFFLFAGILLVLSLLAAACGPTLGPTPTPAVVKEKETVVVEKQVVVTPTPAPKGGNLIIALRNEPAYLDPNVGLPGLGGDAIGRLIFDPLVILAADGSYKPALATSWQVSPDGKVVTLQLRKGVKFSDGTPFNAEAVKFNMDRIVDPATQRKVSLQNIEKYYDRTEVVDEYTVNIRFKDPWPFMDYLDDYRGEYFLMNSPTAVKKGGVEYGQHPVGNGAYILKEWVVRDHITLVKNPDYNWASEYYKHPQPYLDTITWKIVPDDTTRGAVLQTGEVNVVYELPPEWVGKYGTDPNYYVLKWDLLGEGTFYFISHVWSDLKDVRVRQALIYAVDQDAIVRTVYMGLYTPNHGVDSQVGPCYDEVSFNMYRYDPAKAKALLDEAGWKVNPKTGFREKDGKPLKFPLWSREPRLGEILQAQLKAVGVDTEPFIDAGGPLRTEKAKAGDFGLMYGGFRNPDPGQLRTIWHSDAPWNFAHASNPALDKALEGILKGLNRQEKCAASVQAQRIMMQDAVMIPIVPTTQIIGARKGVKGLVKDHTGEWFPDLYDVYVEK